MANTNYNDKYRVVYKNNSLEHHGILGQKWGVRRFQYEDGSLTSAGEKRYLVGAKKKSSSKDDKILTRATKVGGLAGGLTALAVKKSKEAKAARAEYAKNNPKEAKTLTRASKAGGLVGGFAALAVKKAKESKATRDEYAKNNPKEAKDLTKASKLGGLAGGFAALGAQKIKNAENDLSQIKYGSADSYDHSESKVSSKTITQLVRAGTELLRLNPIGAGMIIGNMVAGSAVAKAKTAKVESKNSSGEVDKSTGFHKKESRDYSRKEDMKSVNPGFKNMDANTKNNCMLCTMSYDLRKRGYAVSANKASSGYTSKDLSRWYPKAKVEQIKNTDSDGKLSRSELTKNTISELEKQGAGARGNLMVNWGGTGKFKNMPTGGHSMVYEVNDKGKLEILDCQTNKVYSNPSAILSKCVNASYVRLDNIDIDPTNIKEVAH